MYNYKLDLAPIVYVRAPVSPWAPCLSIDHPVFLFLGNGILFPKLFLSTVRKNCSSDREKLLKFEAEGQEFTNILR